MEYVETLLLHNRRERIDPHRLYYTYRCSHCGAILRENSWTRIHMVVPNNKDDSDRYLWLELDMCRECREKLILFMTTDIEPYNSFNEFLEERDTVEQFVKPLSTNAKHLLARNFDNLNEVMNMTYDDLIKMYRCGKKTATEIMNRIEEFKNEKGEQKNDN